MYTNTIDAQVTTNGEPLAAKGNDAEGDVRGGPPVVPGGGMTGTGMVCAVVARATVLVAAGSLRGRQGLRQAVGVPPWQGNQQSAVGEARHNSARW